MEQKWVSSHKRKLVYLLAVVVSSLVTVAVLLSLPDEAPLPQGWAAVNKEAQALLQQAEQQGKTAAVSAPRMNDQALRSGQEAESSEKIDLNRAGLEQLVQLPGIGESKAKAIIEYREAVGGFKSEGELVKVKGIGPKTFERLKDRISVVHP